MSGEGRVAAVTGASRNIGRAIAVALARDGLAVACFGRDRDALAETAGLVEREGAAASVHVADVADEDAIARATQETVEAHGRLDVVVNNAGMMLEQPSAGLAIADFRRVLDVNLVAYFAFAQAAYPHLRAAGGGVVVNIGSIFGSVGVGRAVSYCASKAAIEGLTRALAVEWAGDGVRVVCVAPGYVESDISRDALADEQLAAHIVGRIPQRRVARPEEVGDLVAFLADARAEFVTGTTVVMDGGQLASV